VHVLVSSLRALAFPSELMGRRIAIPQQLFQLGGDLESSGGDPDELVRPAALAEPDEDS
jgi:hypothetical protein